MSARQKYRLRARSDREVVREVEMTIRHEVGHFLGFDEAELHERGCS